MHLGGPDAVGQHGTLSADHQVGASERWGVRS